MGFEKRPLNTLAGILRNDVCDSLKWHVWDPLRGYIGRVVHGLKLNYVRNSTYGVKLDGGVSVRDSINATVHENIKNKLYEYDFKP